MTAAKKLAPFDWRAKLQQADDILAFAPKAAHIERVDGKGQLVKRFALPLELCQPQNRTRHGQAWALGKLKRECFELMWLQNSHRIEPHPLPGRPMVRAIRFSSVEPDRFSDWAKVPIDRLCVGDMGLGYLRDDRPKDALIECWWEPSPKSAGFAILEVWTGQQ